MTSIKQFSGNVWMWVKAWHEMISFSFKTLHIWIKNIRKGVGIYTHKLCNFNSILGSPTFKGCVLFLKCWWNQQDSSPIHHRYSNINSMWIHVIIWSQWCHFYGCHIWHKWHEIPSTHFDGVDDHHTCVPLTWIITSKQTVEDLIKSLKPLKDKMLWHVPH
jgi:hypothetical protein